MFITAVPITKLFAGGGGVEDMCYERRRAEASVSTFLKVYMELGSYFLFLQEQIKDIIINESAHRVVTKSIF